MPVRKDKISLSLSDYSLCILGESGIGKEQPLSELVATPDGFIPMGDVKLGSYLIGLDGKPTRVTGVFPQGLKPVYKITFSDDTSVRCGLDHLWTVYDSESESEEPLVKSLRELLPEYKNKEGNARYYLPALTGEVEFSDMTDVLGYDPKGLDDYDYYCFGVALSGVDFKYEGTNEFANTLIKDVIPEGIIPEDVLKASVENRYEFLSGAMDALFDYGLAGTGCGMHVFILDTKETAEQLAGLTRSLGFLTWIQKIEEDDETEAANLIGKYEVLYQVPKDKEEKFHFMNPNNQIIEGMIDENNVEGNAYEYANFIEEIEEVEPELCQCVLVDNPDHIYLTKNYIPTHNTTIMVDTCEICFGPDGYILLDIGKEDGVCSLADVTYEHIETFKDFDKLVKDIIKNRNTTYKNLEVLVIDTLDELIEISIKKTIDDYNSENMSKKDFKPAKTLNATWGGFDGPHNYLINMLWDRIWSLKKAGVTCWYTGHVKTRSVIDPLTGASYDVLTTDTMQKEFNAFKKKIQLTGIACMNRKLEKVDTGRKDIMNKKVEFTRVADESRKIVFRDDNHSVDAKSRLKYITDAIPMDADSLIEAIENAIDKYNETTESLKDERTRKREAHLARRKAKLSSSSDNSSNSSQMPLEGSESAQEAQDEVKDTNTTLTYESISEAYKNSKDSSAKKKVVEIVKEYGSLKDVPEERWPEMWDILNG